MERNATKEERDAGYDIADFLLREETKEAIFNRLITLNPALKTLVETFDLQLVNVEKAPLSATVQQKQVKQKTISSKFYIKTTIN